MDIRKSTRCQQGSQSGLHEQLKLVLLDLDLLESEIRHARGVSRNLWWNWRGHRRTVEDLAALIRQGRAA